MNYQTSNKVVSRIINDELIVIQLDTGRYHYFTKDTKEFLEYFRSGASLDTFLEFSNTVGEEKKAIQKLCDDLLERKIFTSAPSTEKKSSFNSKSDLKPRLLRDGEKTLDQISFASP